MMDVAIRALADPRRREILALIRDRELAAGDIATRFDVTRPAISQHLAVLPRSEPRDRTPGPGHGVSIVPGLAAPPSCAPGSKRSGTTAWRA
jgi:hypothetical protein